MSSGRRVNDRRRRVLYSAHHADQHVDDGRKPTRGATSARGQASPRSLWLTRSSPASCPMVLARPGAAPHDGRLWLPCVAAGDPLMCRPLRVRCHGHRSPTGPTLRGRFVWTGPTALGHCMMVALLALSTGASLLIYQLRRYRNDDFKGHYRLWRLVMIVMLLASINAMVGMIDWAGALLDCDLRQTCCV